jgi:tetratricopeptide (TPR) repeat protein
VSDHAPSVPSASAAPSASAPSVSTGSPGSSASTASPEAARKAAEFFARAAQSERSRNWDYAIFQYAAGLQHDPDNLEMCKRLIAAGRQRRAGGAKPTAGKPAADGRTPASAVAAAAETLAADPDNPAPLERLLKAAVAAGSDRVGDWAADELLRVTRAERDGSSRRARLALLADCLEARGRFEVAEQAVAEARRFAPDDYDLSRRALDLAAKRAARDGRYGESAAAGSDFTVSVRNAPAQFVRPDDAAARKLSEARRRWQEAPTDPAAATALVDLLLRPETDESDAEALRVLEAAHAATGDYQFRRRAGDVRIRVKRRRLRDVKARTPAASAPEEARRRHDAEQEATALSLRETELSECRERLAHYPTDLDARFELGAKCVESGLLDEGIDHLQAAEASAKHRVEALNLVGLAFHRKGWHDVAVLTFRRALAAHTAENDAVGRELRYNLGQTLEAMGKWDEAVQEYGLLLSWQRSFRDVGERYERLIRAMRG